MVKAPEEDVEIQFARKLAANEKVERDRALKKVRQWLQRRFSSGTVLSETELLRLWKGLFFCMWMSDKPLVQEQLADDLSELLDCAANVEDALRFASAGFATLRREWNQIDSIRRNKFMMLLRRLFRRTLSVARDDSWRAATVASLTHMFGEQFACVESTALGMQLHMADVYLEELAKADCGGGGDDCKISAEVCHQMVLPYIEVLRRSKDSRLRSAVVSSVFHHLMEQSDPGLAYKNESNPTPADLDSDDGSEGGEGGGVVMDPRAGGVNVCLSQLPVDYDRLASALLEAGADASVRQVNRCLLYKLSRQFQLVSEGEFPRRLPTASSVAQFDSDISDDEIEAALLRRQEFERELHADSRKSAKTRKKGGSKIAEQTDTQNGDQAEIATESRDTSVQASNGSDEVFAEQKPSGKIKKKKKSIVLAVENSSAVMTNKKRRKFSSSTPLQSQLNEVDSVRDSTAKPPLDNSAGNSAENGAGDSDTSAARDQFCGEHSQTSGRVNGKHGAEQHDARSSEVRPNKKRKKAAREARMSKHEAGVSNGVSVEPDQNGDGACEAELDTKPNRDVSEQHGVNGVNSSEICAVGHDDNGGGDECENSEAVIKIKQKKRKRKRLQNGCAESVLDNDSLNNSACETAAVNASIDGSSVVSDFSVPGQNEWDETDSAEDSGRVDECGAAQHIPNFFAKSMSKKLSTSSTKKKKMTKQLDNHTPSPSIKKVNINLSRNTAQAFNEHLLSVHNSPQTPHNPHKIPVKGLLKASNTPRSAKQRVKASDFF